MKKKLSISLIFDYSYLLNPFSFFDIGQSKEFINFDQSKRQFSEDYKNFIHNELENLVELTTTLKTPLSVYFSGTFLKLLEETDKGMLVKLNTAVHEHLELLTGSFTNSLSAAFSLSSAKVEIGQHNNYLNTLFSTKSTKSHVFENIYSNEVSKQLSKQGITTSFAGAIEWYLDGETDTKILKAQCSDNYTVLLPDQDLGDSVYNNLSQKNHFLQLDIEVLQKFNGIKSVVEKLSLKSLICSLDKQISTVKTKNKYNIKTPIMSGIRNISLDTFKSNPLQKSAIKHYYSLKDKAYNSSNPYLLDSWSLIGHSDYFLQMGQNHNDTTYDIYANYMNIINDLELRLNA